MKPLLFLDIDGVLNSVKFMELGTMWGSSLESLDPIACERLERVLAATGAEIVLSSAWRHSTSPELMERYLHKRGCPSARVIDRTPFNSEMPVRAGTKRPRHECERGLEIQHWLDTHPAHDRAFAIVDDSEDMAHLRSKLIRTSWQTGLGEEHIEPLILMLGGAR